MTTGSPAESVPIFRSSLANFEHSVLFLARMQPARIDLVIASGQRCGRVDCGFLDPAGRRCSNDVSADERDP